MTEDVRERIEALICDLEAFRCLPEEIQKESIEDVLEGVQAELEECFEDILGLPVNVRNGLFDRMIESLKQLGVIGSAVRHIVEAFLG